MKIHLGCGPVYLAEYINCDLNIPGHYLSSERPDLVAKNVTTIDEYYTKKVTRKQIEEKKFHKEEVVVDVYCDVNRLPFPDNSIEEIRLVQVFEHFTLPEAKKLLKYWHKKLVNRGVLHIDIPDLAETAKLYVEAQTDGDKEWYTRLLYGSHKNDYGVHKMMYSKDSISRLLYENDYNDLKVLPNIHFYPAFAIEAIKY